MSENPITFSCFVVELNEYQHYISFQTFAEPFSDVWWENFKTTYHVLMKREFVSSDNIEMVVNFMLPNHFMVNSTVHFPCSDEE